VTQLLRQGDAKVFKKGGRFWADLGSRDVSKIP
jgi:hypothetical protein